MEIGHRLWIAAILAGRVAFALRPSVGCRAGVALPALDASKRIFTPQDSFNPPDRYFLLSAPTWPPTTAEGPPLPPPPPPPLLLALHGQNGDAEGYAMVHAYANYSVFDGIDGEAPSMVVGWLNAVHSDGIAGTSGWNAGGNANDDSTCVVGTTNSVCHQSCRELSSARPSCGRCNWAPCFDDVAYVRDVIERIAQERCIDVDRIYAIGESNGAMMVHQALPQLPDTFAAFVPVFGTPLLGYLAGPHYELITKRAALADVAVFALHDRTDTIIPWQGGEDNDGWLYESLNRTIAIWAAVKGCNETAVETLRPPTFSPWNRPSDAAASSNMRYFVHDCSSNGRGIAGDAVDLGFAMYDGIHGTWPLDALGADKLIMRFLAMHSRNASY